MKLIPLTKGYSAKVSDIDFDRVNKHKWYASVCAWTVYAERSWKKNGKKYHISMHRYIKETPVGLFTDHVDHNGLNNQRENLRICTQSENQKNKSSKKNGTSKYLGVSLRKDKKVNGEGYYYAWRANIKLPCGKNLSLGTFKTEENAAIAYNIVAEKYHGDFANYNTVNT